MSHAARAEGAMALVKSHRNSLAGATWLSNNQVKNAIAPREVIRRLASVAPNTVLVGTYGLVGWIEKPRATTTVEVLVALGLHRKATTTLRRAFPRLVEERQEMSTDLRDPNTQWVAIRIMKPLEPRYRQTLRRIYAFRWKGLGFRVPAVEMALVLTYMPMMVLPGHAPEKYLNAHDFMRVALVNRDIEVKKLVAIAGAVCPDHTDDLLAKVTAVQAGASFDPPNSILPHG